MIDPEIETELLKNAERFQRGAAPRRDATADAVLAGPGADFRHLRPARSGALQLIGDAIACLFDTGRNEVIRVIGAPSAAMRGC